MSPAWPVRLTSELHAADAQARALTWGLTAVQLNWRLQPNTWSIAQCLEHLSLVNEVYVGPMSEALRGKVAAPVDDITPGWFGRWFIRTYIDPNTQRQRARAPRKATPVARVLDAEIVERFVASNAAIRTVIGRAQDHDVNRVRFRNPFLSVIRFTVGTGLEIVVRHNQRHLRQAERVKQSPEFPRG